MFHLSCCLPEVGFEHPGEMQVGCGSGPSHNRVNKQKLPEPLESVRSSAWLIVLPLQSEITNTLVA